MKPSTLEHFPENELNEQNKTKISLVVWSRVFQSQPENVEHCPRVAGSGRNTPTALVLGCTVWTSVRAILAATTTLASTNTGNTLNTLFVVFGLQGFEPLSRSSFVVKL